MSTGTRTAAVLVVLASLAAAAAHGATASPPRVLSLVPVETATAVGRELAGVRRAYGWPVKPFDRQHPVRGFLNDPRIAGTSRTFHFGVDVVAPDGTPVYAVEAGTVQLHSGPAVIVHAGSHWIGYWHIDAVVRPGQHVQLHQLLGRIGRSWGHVHLCEYRNGLYLNPLRPGGMGPYEDRTKPAPGAFQLVPTSGGRVAIVATVADLPWPQVPGAWADEPVTPALVRWRLIRNGHAGPWQTAIDSRSALLDSSLFGSVYAPGTRQNHKGKPGRYRIYLDRAWRPSEGAFRLELLTADTAGNATLAAARFAVVDATPVREPAVSGP